MSRFIGPPVIFSGNAHPQLARDVCAYLNLEPGEAEIFTFANGNTFVRLLQNIRERDVFLVQPGASPVNHHIVELLIMIDAVRRASAGRVTAVAPYFAYGRSDKKDQPRVPITDRLVANIMETAGVDRYMTIDLHSGQIQGFFNIPGDALTAFHLLSDYVKTQLTNGDLDNLVVVATDLGFAKQGRNWAEALAVPLAFVEKRRVDNAESPEALSLIGDVKGKTVLLVDDEVNTASSIVNAVHVVQDYGARDVLLAFTHPFFTDEAYQRFSSLNLREIIFTNTLPLPNNRKLPNMTVLSIAPLLGEVILRAHEGRSVGALFNE